MLYFRQAKWSKIEQPVAQSPGIAIKNLYEKGPEDQHFPRKSSSALKNRHSGTYIALEIKRNPEAAVQQTHAFRP